ncbi:hypothetical protein IRZ81_11000 [Pseudomonas putida]|uniref:hypothetical protein n=1 Tax=Pseudomonas putida TaxID=303 RepID=UPI0018AAA0C1|nr:hypothetical protein [Pseudomonas putida]MBF8651329.1 hypothetical protein [Pseudomonas putida]MBF8655025.1 hypothetical protein [Pseudomonas putida]
MAYLVRKISRGKWQLNDDVGPVNADAITLCLRTSGNTLSFWRVNREEDVLEGVLAIAASNDNLDKLDIVVLEEARLVGLNLRIDVTPGKTACTDLISSHRDLAGLTVRDLATVSEEIAAEIRSDNVKRYGLKRLKEIVQKAVDDKRIELENLSEGVRKKLSAS